MDVVISVSTIVVYFLTIWLTNIDFFFKGAGKIDYYYQVYSLATAATLLNLALRCSSSSKQQENPARLK